MTLTASPQTVELTYGTRDAVAACVDVLREVVAGLDANGMLATEAPDVWETFDEIERLGVAAKILITRRVADSGVWKDAGMRSPAEYLALRAGTTRNVARDALKTSERLSNLPQVEDALRRGELSAAQAHPIADAASHDPTAQSALLNHAKVASLKELKDECLRRKASADPKPQDTRDRIHKNRYFRLSTDAEGAWRLYGRGPLDHTGAFGATLNPLIDDLFKKARQDGTREERDALAYDALQEMARLARAAYYGDDPDDDEEDAGHTPSASDRGYPRWPNDAPEGDRGVVDAERSPDAEPGAGDDRQPLWPGHEYDHDLSHGGKSDGSGRRRRRARSRKTRRKRMNPSHLAILRLDVEALRRGSTDEGERCEIAGVGPIPVDTARGLLGEAVLKLVLTKGAAVANVVHLGRGPNAAQRAALLWSQPECSVQGCCHTFTQIDHRHDWHLCHETTLHNLDRLCPHHHRKKTYEGWALVAGTGKRPMVPPNDPRHPRNVVPAAVSPHGSVCPDPAAAPPPTPNSSSVSAGTGRSNEQGPKRPSLDGGQRQSREPGTPTECIGTISDPPSAAGRGNPGHSTPGSPPTATGRSWMAA